MIVSFFRDILFVNPTKTIECYLHGHRPFPVVLINTKATVLTSS